MTSRIRDIEDAPAAFASTVQFQGGRVSVAATDAEARGARALDHGWDGVAQGYETAARHLDEIADEPRSAHEQADDCAELLRPIPDAAGLDEVAGHLGAAADELGAALDGILSHLDEARDQLEATGEEYLVGVLRDLIEQVQESAGTLAGLRELISAEQATAAAGSRASGPGPTAGGPAGVQARIEELRRSGHAPQRHGAHITDQQLIDRALWGKDPITGTTTDGETGSPHQYGRDATKFTTDEALVEAEKYIRSSPEFDAKRRQNEVTGILRIRVQLPLAQIFGEEYLRHVHGIRRTGSRSKPTGDPPGSLRPTATDFTDGTIFAFFRRTENGEYKLRTMYPQPKDEHESGS